jgi:two-component system cell cycle sensor histidine kinase/response regulator CckA
LALDAARMGAWEWTIATNRVDWSEQVGPIFGLAHGTFTGGFDTYLNLIHSDDSPMVTRTVEAAMQSSAGDFVIEHRILWPDGSTRWLEGRGRVFRDIASRPVRMAGTVMDITARKQAEERYRAISELVSDYTFGFRVEADGAISLEWVTDIFTRVTGHTQDAIGSIEAWEQLIHPDDLIRVRTERVKMLGGDTVVQEYRVRHNDGQMIWLRVYSRPLIDAVSGRVTHIYGAAQDITRLKQLEQQLFQAQKLDAMGRLAGGIAHDFNNLLTVILGNTDLLAGLEAAHPFHHEVAQVRDAAERAARLTRQLLAFSRKQMLVPSVVDLNAVVADIAPLLRRLIGEHITLRTQLAPTIGQILADPGQLEQVIVNLAVNARDAMPEGGTLILETANAVLDAPTGGNYVLLAVSDTGIGMDAQTRERIFEPFFTTKDVGKGTGLGLATVYGIVTQSGGRLWVYSEVGQGTTIKAYLPRHDAPVQAIEGEVPEGGAPDGWGNATILLVEDDVGVRELVERLLRTWGHQVLVASDARDALRVAGAAQGPIHLLLTDVIMPGGMNGVALAAQLLAAQPSLRVLYMSGYSDTVLTSLEVLVTGQSLIMKPFTANELAQAVRAALAPIDTLPAPAAQA